MASAGFARTSGWQRLGTLLLAVSLYGCSSSTSGSHEAGVGVGGASGAETGNPSGGAPGPWDAASTTDATGVNPGTSDATGVLAETGIGGDGAGGRDGTVLPADAPAAGGYDGSPGDGLLTSADRGLSSELGAGEAGISGDVANPRDVGISDVPAPQMLDAAGDSQQIDAPLGRDAVVDAARADGGLVDDSGAAACIPEFPFVMPSTLPEVQETYDVCLPPRGFYLSDITWTDHIWGNELSLAEAQTCVADGDPQIGVATGAPFRAFLGVNLTYVGEKYNHPLRFYAIYQDQGGVQVSAAYDLVYLAGDAGSQPPPYPERYVRFDLVCGDPDAIPRLKGWTGRIGVYRVSTSFRPGMLARFWFVLWGSAAGETGERMLLLFADVP